MAMTLARALKYKNRIAARLREVGGRIQENNSVIVGNTPDYDVNSLLSEHEKLRSHMVELKVAIQKANGPILGDILSLSEIKSFIDILRSMSTRNGKAPDRYSDVVTEYRAVLLAIDVEKQVLKFEREIDAVQERIDSHNHNTTIGVESIL